MGQDQVTAQVKQRIERARSSRTGYGSMDMFIGPFLGRETSTTRLKNLLDDIAEPQEFCSWEYVLVVEGRSDLDKGKLVILGGGHRLLSASLVLHALVLPYKLVSFDGIIVSGVPFSIYDHEGPIAFHIEVSETRPETYGFMEQVRLYGRLKERWRKGEDERVSKLRGKKATPKSLSHRKLYEYYDRMMASTGPKCRWAIGFMKTKTHATRRHYMSGADRILEGGVLPYLSHLESTGVATFNRASLNAVRKWSVEKIRKVVALWKVRHETGVKVQFLFSDRAGREIDGKGRGRKNAKATSNFEALNSTSNQSGDEVLLECNEQADRTIARSMSNMHGSAGLEVLTNLKSSNEVNDREASRNENKKSISKTLSCEYAGNHKSNRHAEGAISQITQAASSGLPLGGEPNQNHLPLDDIKTAGTRQDAFKGRREGENDSEEGTVKKDNPGSRPTT